MKKRMMIFLVVVALMAVLLLTTVCYQVNYNQLALIKTFGSPTFVEQEAGLHFKWPWPIQRVVTYETNTHVMEDALQQQKLHDGQHVLLTMYCAWRIKPAQKDVVNFDGNFEASVSRAEQVIRGLLESDSGSAVAGFEMRDLVNTDPKKMRLAELETKVMESLKAKVGPQYGVEIVMLGVKSLGVTDNVTKAIIEAQQAERKRDIEAYNTEGRSVAQAIREKADAESRQIIEFAKRKAELIRAQGLIAAAKYYHVFDKAPELSMFLRSLDSLKKELPGKTVMLFDMNNLPALKMFQEGASAVFAPTTQPTTQPAPASGK